MEKPELSIDLIDEDLAVKLLKYECKLRKSAEMQDYYEFLNETEKGREETVENFVQFKTIRDNNFKPTIKSLSEYRKISTKFYNSDRVKQSAYYLKYNIMEPGNLHLGDKAPDVPLLTLNKEKCYMRNFMTSSKPLVILSGSIS